MTDDHPVVDRLARPIHDLRISITDRCNFRCVYCMPKEKFGRDHKFLAKRELLSFEEIERVARIFGELGVRKLRITGGEPLLRADVVDLVGRLVEVPGIDDVSMTTNASLVSSERARALRDAGLRRVNVSLDSLDDDDFVRINDVGCSVRRVLDGIDALQEAGFDPIKVNMVVRRGLNEQSILPMARHFHGTPVILRFIEYMDVGSTNGWRLSEVYSAREIHDTINAEMPLESLQPNYLGEVARRWRYCDGGGEIGIISSVTQPFCRHCSRARLSAVGKLYTCLFAPDGFDLRAYLRSGCDDRAFKAHIAGIWRRREDRYSELRSQVNLPRKVEMSHIGG
ncbi:MAG: GTP 3',8-cyclase MoaA [Proteobacteria bacterium]|nr:MAG: GTP 3',8-cyclase MoaA [Pseudomonadota bacterium]